MYITEQINRAECGICVLNTLFYHYYGRNIKQELLKLAPISEQGINIFDLENLAIKHGILLESYHASITELMTIKNNGLLITLVKEKDGLHYTLIKIHKKYIEIFDSIKGHYQINLDNFNQIYTGTIIIPHKHKIQFDENNKFNFHPFFKFRYVLTNLFLQLAVIISSIVGANYFRMIMIHGTSQKSIKNLILVSFVFLLFFVINELAVFVQRLLIRKTVHINCMLLTKQFIDSLTKKNNQFHLKNDITKLNRVEEAIMYICNFHGWVIINFISGIITCILIMSILTFINHWYMIACLSYILISGSIGLIVYQQQKKIIQKNINYNTANENATINTINYFKNQQNKILMNKNIDDLKINSHEINKSNYQSEIHHGWRNFINALCGRLILIAIIMIGSISIIDAQLSLGMLILTINLLSLFTINFNHVINFKYADACYRQMQEIYDNFTMIGNIENGSITLPLKIKTVAYTVDDSEISIKNGQTIFNNQTKFNYAITCQENNKHFKVKINNIKVDEFKIEDIYDRVIIFNYDTKLQIDDSYLNQLITYNCVIDFIKLFHFNIKRPEKILPISYYQIINFLISLTCRNHIIIFDNSWQYINKQMWAHIKKYIIPQIKKFNFVIFENNEIHNQKKSTNKLAFYANKKDPVQIKSI